MDVIRFMGGLGNQMFQYALLKALENRGRDVVASLGFYSLHPELRQYEIEEVFCNTRMNTEIDEKFLPAYRRWCSDRDKQNKISKEKKDLSNCYFWKETEEQYGNYQEGVFETNECVFTGYWQSYKYFVDIRNLLVHDFAFKEGEDKLKYIINKIKSGNNYVSIHIRRGDYLNSPEVYGGICNIQYYNLAIKYIMEVEDNPIFVFVSDDIAWVKQNFVNLKAIYVDPNDFDRYKSWYDMKIMTVCKYNIIANSTFSWWGAWLNQRDDKLVIAPKKWSNVYSFNDICPDKWVRL